MSRGVGIRTYQLHSYFSEYVNDEVYCTYNEINKDAPGGVYWNCRITSTDEDEHGINVHFIRPDGTTGCSNVNPNMYVHTWNASEDCNPHFKKYVE